MRVVAISSSPGLHKLIFTATVFAAATVGTLVFWGVLFHRVPFALYFAAVTVVAWRVGWLAGLGVGIAGALTVAGHQRFPADLIGPSVILIGVSTVVSYLAASRERALDTLRGSQRQYRLMVENVRDYAMFMIDAAGNVSQWNAGAERVLGWKEEEIVGRPASLVFTPEDRQAGADTEEWAAARRDGHAASERWHQRKDGSRFFAVGIMMRVNDDAGSDVGFIKVLRDVTERMLADEERRSIEARWQRLVEQSPQSIQVFAPDGTVRQVNRAWERLWGITLADVPGYNILQDPQLAASGMMPRFERAFTGEPVTIDPVPYTLERGEFAGRQRWVGAYMYPVKDGAGQVEEVVLVHQDVTERRYAEEALRTSEARYAAGVRAALDCIVLMDHQGRVTDWNPAAERTFGYTRDEALGRELASLVIPSSLREPDLNCLGQFFSKGEGLALGKRFEMDAVRKDGHQLQVELSVTRLPSEGPAEFLAYLRDITDAKRAEALLRDSERRFRDMADTAPATLWVTEPDGYCSFLSRGWYDLTGQAEASGLGFGWVDAVHPDDRELAREAFVAANTARKPYGVDFRIRRADGEYIWAIDAARPRFGPGGEYLGMIGSVIDITERKAAEAALRESERRFRLMADAVPQIVWITDAEGRVEFFNQQWSKYTGVDDALATADDVATAVIHPDDRAATTAAYAAALASGETFLVEHRIRSATGEYRWFLVRGEPYRDPESGRIVRWFGASVDIHDRTRAEEALRESEERLRAVFEQTEAGIAQTDLAGRFILANERYAQIIGRRREELLGLRMQDLTHPDDLSRNMTLFQKAVADGTPFVIEKRYVRPDGTVV